MSRKLQLVYAAVGSILLGVVTVLANGGNGNEKPDTAAVPFRASEQLIYEGEFTKLMLRGINVVDIVFDAQRKEPSSSESGVLQSEHMMLFKGEVKSKGWFGKLFGINFNYLIESLVDERSLSVLRTNKLDEQGKRVRVSEAVFDRDQNRVTWTERDPNSPERPPRVVTSQTTGPMIHDIVSALYYLRTQQLSPGQFIDLQMSDSGLVFHIPARVVEKKRLKTTLGKVPTVRVEIGVFGPQGLVARSGSFSVWFTDNSRHIPVRARIETEFGRLDLNLKSVR